MKEAKMQKSTLLESTVKLDRIHQLQSALSLQVQQTMEARDLDPSVSLSLRVSEELAQVQACWGSCESNASAIDFRTTLQKARKAMGEAPGS